jgi:xylulokinase
MAADLILAIDLGTTTIKLAVLGPEGQLVQAWSRAHPTARPGPGLAEQDPALWMALIDEGLAEIAELGLGPRIAAIGLTSQVNTHVFLDAQGRPLLPAILWQDTRCADVAAVLAARTAPEDLIRWFGAPIPIDASHPLARMGWLAATRPDLWDKTWKMVLPKDLLLLHLTGELATDPVSNIGLADARGMVAEALALVPGAAERLAPVLPAEAVGGRVKAGAFKGVPVVVGTMDGWASVFGGAGAEEGAGVHVSGTSEILGLVSPEVVPTPGIVVFAPLLGLRLHAGPTQAGGAALQWFSAWSGLDLAAIDALVAAQPRSRATPLFLPQLQGERAPLWDASLRGAFLGLETQTGMADIARAVMEGVALGARHVMEGLEASGARRPEVITCGGGGFRSPVWTRIKAEVMGRPYRRLTVNEPALLGAVSLAAHGAGLFPTLGQAHAALVVHGAPILPDPARVAAYDRLFALYTEAISTTAKLSARLATF